jgi:hypothetical protein
MALVPAVLLASVLAACAGTVTPHATSQGEGKAVPWAALPIRPAPAVTPLTIPPGTAPCAASQLEGHYVGGSGLTGGEDASDFGFANSSAAPCQLDGTPAIHLSTSSGTEITIKPGPDPLGPLPSQPVLLLPGLTAIVAGAPKPGQALVLLVWPDIDEATGGTTCSPPPPVATTITFALPEGIGQISVAMPTAGVHSAPIAPCGGLLATSPFQAVTPTPTPTVPQVSARIEAPVRAAAGTVLWYRVVLANTSKVAINLRSTCAGYVEILSGGTAAPLKVVGQYELNCAAAGVLRPQASVTFAMALTIPETAPRVRAYLDWTVQPGSGFVPTAAPVVARVKITQPSRSPTSCWVPNRPPSCRTHARAATLAVDVIDLLRLPS